MWFVRRKRGKRVGRCAWMARASEDMAKVLRGSRGVGNDYWTFSGAERLLCGLVRAGARVRTCGSAKAALRRRGARTERCAPAAQSKILVVADRS